MRVLANPWFNSKLGTLSCETRKAESGVGLEWGSNKPLPPASPISTPLFLNAFEEIFERLPEANWCRIMKLYIRRR